MSLTFHSYKIRGRTLILWAQAVFVAMGIRGEGVYIKRKGGGDYCYNFFGYHKIFKYDIFDNFRVMFMKRLFNLAVLSIPVKYDVCVYIITIKVWVTNT